MTPIRPACWLAALIVTVAAVSAAAEPLPSCAGCNPYEHESCLLAFGSSGVVHDAVTGDPIVGATIAVLGVQTVSAADGTYEVSGARQDSCNIDYFYSIHVSAPGYAPFAMMYWTSSAFSHLTIALEPDIQAPTPTVCPERTPCILGERPRPCADQPCGLGCGCEPCPPCGDGERAGSRANACECVPDPSLTPPTPTATPAVATSPSPPSCPGDCNDDRAVTINELIDAVDQALGGSAAAACTSADLDRNGAVVIAELVTMVAAALDGCPA